MKAKLFTLLSVIILLNSPIYAQSDWWEDLDLPMDTIYVGSCDDFDKIRNNSNYFDQIYDHWIFPENEEYDYINFTFSSQFTFDQDSNCIGGLWEIHTLNWLEGSVISYERNFAIDSSLPGPCGMHFSYDEQEAEEGINISELDPSADSISFSMDGTQDDLFLTPEATDTFSIPVFHLPGPSVCFVNIEVVVCEGNYVFEAKEEIDLDIGTNFCTVITLDEAEITAEYECADFALGFLRSDGTLSDQLTIPYTQNNPNRIHTLTLAMRTEDGKEYTRTLDVNKTADDFPEPQIYVFSDNPYLNKGETTYLGVGGDIEDLLVLQAEIILSGAKVLEVSSVHPKLELTGALDYNITESTFKFLFLHPVTEIFTFDEGLPWFVLEIESTQDGHLSDLIDIDNPNNFNELALETEECNATIHFNFPFVFSQTLLFSNTSDLSWGETAEVFPNPARDFAVVEWSRIEPVEVHLYDLTGRQLLRDRISQGSLEYSLKLDHYSPGIYLIKLQDSKGRYVTGRLMVKQ